MKVAEVCVFVSKSLTDTIFLQLPIRESEDIHEDIHPVTEDYVSIGIIIFRHFTSFRINRYTSKRICFSTGRYSNDVKRLRHEEVRYNGR